MAIRDQSYTRYDGPIRERHAWAVIGWTGFRTYWRFWRTKLILFAVWLVPLVFALLIIGEAALFDESQLISANENPGHGGVRFLLGVQLYSLALVFVANGCGIISDDLRHRTVQLYFSKPISRLEYGIGKVVTLLILGLISVLIPAVLLAILRTAFYAQGEFFAHMATMHALGVVLLALVVVLLSSLVVGISSLTRRTGYAVLAWIGILLIPLIVQAIVTIATDGSAWASMASVSGMVGLAADAMLGNAGALPEEIPAVVPFLGIFTLIAAGFSALYWRISQLEGIA